MNDKAREIRELIRKMGDTGEGSITIPVEITAVSDQDCSVKFGETVLTNVRLFSQATDAGNILMKPKVGSMATILVDPDYRDPQIIQCDNITSFKFVENGLNIEFDSETKKIDIKNDQVGLKDLMQAVADIVKQLTVATPAGPSGTPLPPTITQVNQFETNFKKLLK